jgi:Skp family chaperone for outer membrane proteins
MQILTGIGIVIGLVLLAGLVAGQFRRGVVDELRDALQTAKTEIDIERARSDRLEREAQQLRTELAGLRAEVATLRSVLTDDRKLASTIAEALRRENDTRAEHFMDEIKEAMGRHTALVIEAVQKERQA